MSLLKFGSYYDEILILPYKKNLERFFLFIYDHFVTMWDTNLNIEWANRLHPSKHKKQIKTEFPSLKITEVYIS